MFVAKTDLIKSLDYFTRATTLDPNFALAFYRVSWCYYYLGYNSVLDPKETNPKARAALQRALELDDTLPEAHLLMAEIKRSEWDWAGAENELNRFLELNPNTADAHGIEAIAILNKLKTTKDYVSPSELAILYVGLGDKDAAFQSLEKAYALRDLQLQNLKTDPLYDDLHDDPRFQDLVRRIDVP